MMGMGRSGGERVLSQLANYLSDKGEDVFVVAPETNCSPYYPLNSKITILKSKVRKTRFKVLDFFYNIYQLILKSRQVNADVALANYFLTAYVVIFLKKKVKKFYYIQAYEVNFSSGIVFKTLAFISYILPLRKIVNSKLLLPSIINKYEEILSPGVDLELFKRANKEAKRDKFSIGFIGRKEIHKGSNEIVDVLSGIENDSFRNLVFNVAVYIDPKWKDKLQSVVYHNVSSDNELADFYRLNDLIIATGLIEDGAFHYPCAEAIATKCLVISNYSPLSNTPSQFYMHTFNKVMLKDKIEKVLKLTQSEIDEEVSRNYSVLKGSDWNSVGEKFHMIISN